MPRLCRIVAIRRSGPSLIGAFDVVTGVPSALVVVCVLRPSVVDVLRDELGEYAVLIRSLPRRPATGTHRSRGIDRIDAFSVVGSTCNTIIVSVRSPPTSPVSPNLTVSDLSFTNARVSEPT